jgi:hypothetical protein
VDVGHKGVHQRSNVYLLVAAIRRDFVSVKLRPLIDPFVRLPDAVWVNMERLWNNTDKRKPNDWEKSLSRCHFVHLKSHMDRPGREPDPRRPESGELPPKLLHRRYTWHRFDFMNNETEISIGFLAIQMDMFCSFLQSLQMSVSSVFQKITNGCIRILTCWPFMNIFPPYFTTRNLDSGDNEINQAEKGIWCILPSRCVFEMAAKSR